jgi:hypothetical protein
MTTVALEAEPCATCDRDVICVRTVDGGRVIVDDTPSASAGTVLVHLGAHRPSAAVLTTKDARRRRNTGLPLYALHSLSCANPVTARVRRARR